jgi:hypothetical protein
MRFAAFDLEIAKLLPERVDDLKAHAPLGIACAAVALGDGDETRIWQGVPQMTPAACRELVGDLQQLAASGYTLLTWNGCSFDFFVLAQESGLLEECADLALAHVDLMLTVTFTKGYYLGLDKALQGAGLAGKRSSVTLRDGSILDGMSGVKAPALWADGEYEAVLAYLKDDVLQLSQLGEHIRRTRSIQWTSGRGRPQFVAVERFLSVRECFAIPEPDTSWMSNPPTRAQFVDWMPNWQDRIE